MYTLESTLIHHTSSDDVVVLFQDEEFDTLDEAFFVFSKRHPQWYCASECVHMYPNHVLSATYEYEADYSWMFIIQRKPD